MGQKGRWLEARAGDLRGWLPRTTVESGAPAPVWIGPASLVHVLRTVAARSRPDAASTAVFEAAAGSELRSAGERRSGWVLVENADGLVGWIPSHMLRAPTTPERGGAGRADPTPVQVAGAAATTATGDVAVSAAESPGPGPAARLLSRPSWIRARAALGLSSFDMDFSSNGTTPLSGYRLSASALAVFTEVELGLRRGRVRTALDASYCVAIGLPGIRTHDGEGGALEPIGFTWHHMNAGGRVGYLIGDSWAPHFRAGYHFDWLRIDDVTNSGRLARDGLSGFTVGLGVEGALSDELIVRAGGDVLVGASRKQTPGLEDGQTSSALAGWVRLEASYLVNSAFAVEGNYQYGWASTEWIGQSPRQPDVTRAVRTDHSHLLLVALVRHF